MFCKLCGNDISASDRKCRRCGKEVPALSDCGGFFDLVPGADNRQIDKTVPIAAPVESEVLLCVPEQSKKTNRTAQPANNGRWLMGLAVLTAAGFAITILMLVLLFGRVSRCTSEISGLRNTLWKISEKVDTIAESEQQSETVPEETAHPEIEKNPVLAEQNIIFAIKTDEEKKAHVDVDLGECADTAVVTCETNQQTGALNAITCYLEDTGGSVQLTIDHNNGPVEQKVAVIYAVDDAAFGATDAAEVCKWQYRIAADTEWLDIPEDVFAQTDTPGKTGISAKTRALQELVGKNAGYIELRCEICRTNNQNGSFVIIVECVKFYVETNNEETFG